MVEQRGQGAGDDTAGTLERRWWLPATGIAGIAGPIIFAGVVIVQSLRYTDYSDMALPISALAAWPHGWLQNMNFFLLGSLMVTFAIGLHFGMRPNRASVMGPALLALSGVGLLLAGAFPWRESGGVLLVPTGHRLGALLSFAGAGLGLIAISRRMAADPRWRGLATYALVSGIAIVGLFLVTFSLAIPPDGPLHAWLGLLQRVTLVAWFPCTVVLALRLREVARSPAALR